MTKHIMFPSIDQFRSTVKKVKDRAKDAGISRPTIRFRGSIKLHGTNCGLSAFASDPTNYWVQSRTSVISKENDNYGFANHVAENDATYKIVLASVTDLFEKNGAIGPNSVVTIFGEWCGGNIQQGVALTQLSKMFVAFGACVSNGVNDFGETRFTWLDPAQLKLAFGFLVKNIYDFTTYVIDIDFAAPEKAQNQLADTTRAVEANCPFGAAFGVNGIGEGVVYTAFPCDNPHIIFKLDDLTFKVKGAQHSVSKVKTLASVDVEAISSVKEFVASVATDARLKQGVQALKSNSLAISNRNTGAFLKWVTNDVIKEESDTMSANGLDVKKVMPVLSAFARDWYLNNLEE